MSGGEQILVLAPRGRDADVIEGVLRRAGMPCQNCSDLDELRGGLGRDLGAVLVTEEALAGARLAAIHEWCDSQPAWSDLPFIVLTSKQLAKRPERAAALLERLGNVILLERPINAETLMSAARSALRGRRRQYQSRSLLLEREQTAGALQRLNATLEQSVQQRTRELESARETLAFALDSAGLGSWDLDLTTNVARHSPQYDRIFGYDRPAGAASRAILAEHLLEEETSAVDTAFARALETGALELDCRIRRLDGAMRWIVVKGRVEYSVRRPVRMAGIIMDMTERRETEQALRQAQKMEAIGQLTGGVAHDFNNLLTVIVGGLDMMIRRPEQPERVVRLAQAAMTAARRGEQLTQQLLAFSRRQLLHPQTLNPNRLLLDFKGLAERAAGEAVVLELDLDPAIDPIRIDPAQFEAAVLNLIVNARDAMPNGGRITLKSARVRRETGDVAGRNLSPGQYVVVSVTDEGEGIEPETLARVFEPFFTTKEVGKGSGLGLAQVYGFARSAGGDVAIESKRGAGTAVRLFFPRSSDAISEEVQTVAGKVPLRRAASGETVLLVEDDEQVLGMAIESLEELHYKVIVAHNAREALAHLTGADRIDILFSDVVMPGGMNGAQLAVEARYLRPELKVLLTSGYVAEQGADHGIGIDVPVLNKPYRREDLARQLRVVLGDVGRISAEGA
jgi:PAS domain S-box-containing protein